MAKLLHQEKKVEEPVLLRHMAGDVYVTIQHKHDYIEAKWCGHITADNVVCAAQAYLELLRSSGCPKLLNDKSEVTGDWQEANDWLQYEWLPHVIEAGLRSLAHVYSFNMFSKLAARELEVRVSPQLNMKNFYERSKAEDWLADANLSDMAHQRAATA